MKQRILVVDGDPGSRRLVEMLLTGHDVDVIGAATDEEAYRRVLELGPDLLLVEVLVPRHGGLEFLRKIRTVRGGQDVPALVMSALCRDADVRKEAVGELGALDFMKKPLSRDLLRGRLQSVLGEQEAESAPGEPLPFQGAEIYDRGSLTDVQSPVLFHGLAQNQTTGCLYLRHGASKKVVYFHDGSITFALSNQVRDTLGQHLAGRGKIDEETIKAALQAMRSEGKKMGEYLVQAGLLGLSEMHEAVRQNVLEKVLDVFTWQGGDFRLSSYKNPPAPLPGEAFPVSQVLWEGVRKPFPEDRLRSTLDPHSEVPLYPRRDLLDLASEVPLESEDVRLLRTVRRLHGHPLGHVLSEIGDERGIRFLYYLLLQGYLSLGGSNDGDPSTRKLTPDTAARIRSARRRLDSLRRRNHFQVLEVPLDGDDARVHQAYLRKAKDVHPDTLGPHEPAGLRQVYNDTFQRIRASYEAIKTENGRREHLRSLEGKVEKKPVTDKAEIMEAEVCFQEGKVLLKQRKWDAAAEAFEKALSLNPEEAEYTLGLGSARVHQAAAGRRDLLSEAEDLLEKARGSMPGSPEPCYQLGRLESLRGGLESAASHFENALQHDPNHWLAMRELRVMNMRTRDKSNRQFGRV